MGVYAQYGDLPNDIRSLKVILLRMCMCVRVCVGGGGGVITRKLRKLFSESSIQDKEKILNKGSKSFPKKG